jgi:hypothetical protein
LGDVTDVMGNLKVDADIHHNRLYFNFVGIATQKEMEGLYTDVRFCLADLKPGFDVISDYSECTLIHLNSIPALKKIMSFLIENGLGEIVRVLQSDRIAHKQVLNLATRVQGYKPIYVSNLDEAEEELKKAVKRKGLRVHLHNVPIEYMTGNEEGKGNILNMSMSGCAVKYTTFRPEDETEILLNVTFTNKDNSPELFKIKAKVVRVDNNVFAAEFIDFDDESKELVWKCLLHESRR